MTVAELITILEMYPKDKQVEITDGHKYHFYKGDFDIQLFTNTDGETIVDIGVGGFVYE